MSVNRVIKYWWTGFWRVCFASIKSATWCWSTPLNEANSSFIWASSEDCAAGDSSMLDAWCEGNASLCLWYSVGPVWLSDGCSVSTSSINASEKLRCEAISLACCAFAVLGCITSAGAPWPAPCCFSNSAFRLSGPSSPMISLRLGVLFCAGEAFENTAAEGLVMFNFASGSLS